MKTRIEKIQRKLEEYPGYCMISWISPFYEKHRPLVNLESSFLIACAKNSAGEFRACRFTGTLEQNEIKHQRILFEGETLVRIRNGPRTNLVVKPQYLRYEETAVVAGLIKSIEYGKGRDTFYHSRDGDIEFLKQLEDTLFRKTLTPVQITPYPEPYKKVRDPEQVEPRITGELVTKLRELGATDPEESVTKSFYKNIEHFCEKKGGSYIFPMKQVNGRGLTMLDMSSVADESYLLPISSLDQKSELFRFDLVRTMEKGKDKWIARSS